MFTMPLLDVSLTPQLRCFSALAGAAVALSDMDDGDKHFGLHYTPDALLHLVVDRVAACGGLVVLRHALIEGVALSVTLSCEDAVVEAEVECTPRGLAKLYLLDEALRE